jgi:diacylglycerol O-acyltransferase
MTTPIERLSLFDLTNVAVEAQDTPMHQGGLGVLAGDGLLDDQGRVRIELVRAHIEARLDRVPSLRRKLWRTRPFEGRPLWMDDPDFRIENHVLVAQLAAPGGERRAFECAEGKMATLMDRSRPLWQLWFLEGYGQGKVGVFLKLHHVLADGTAILNIISLLFDLQPIEHLETRTDPWSPQAPPSHGALIRDNMARKADALGQAGRRLAHPWVLLRSIAGSLRAFWAAVGEGMGAPKTSLNRPIGPHRSVGVVRLPLSDVKQIAHSRGVKVNDMILEVVAAGIRRVLTARRESTEGVSIRASMAVLLAANSSAVSGNHAGSMIVPLPIDGRSADDRLAAIAGATARAKRTQRAADAQAFSVVVAVAHLTRLFIRRQRMVNILVTNLAGPQFPLYVAGARLLDAVAITPLAGNVTASFAALSYDGHLNLSVHVDGQAWPDFDVLMRGMALAWRELALPLAA